MEMQGLKEKNCQVHIMQCRTTHIVNVAMATFFNKSSPDTPIHTSFSDFTYSDQVALRMLHSTYGPCISGHV